MRASEFILSRGLFFLTQKETGNVLNPKLCNKINDKTETTLTYQDAVMRSVSVNTEMIEDVRCKYAWGSALMLHPTFTLAGSFGFRLAKYLYELQMHQQSQILPSKLYI